MGRIVRRYARFYEQEQRGNFEQGLWGAGLGIDDYEASQILHSTVLCTTGIDGSPIAGQVGVHVNAAHVGDVIAHKVRASLDAAALTMTGDLFGTRRDVDVGDATVLTGHLAGVYDQITIQGEVTSWVIGHRYGIEADAGATLGGDVWGLSIGNYMLVQPAGAYDMIRIAENGTAIVDRIFHIGCNDVRYFMRLTNIPGSGAWDQVTDVTGGGGNASVGFLLVQVPAGTRRIPMYA